MVKNLPVQETTRDAGSISGFGRSPVGGSGNPLQYSCLENSMDRAWQATVHGVAKSRTQLNSQLALPLCLLLKSQLYLGGKLHCRQEGEQVQRPGSGKKHGVCVCVCAWAWTSAPWATSSST